MKRYVLMILALLCIASGQAPQAPAPAKSTVCYFGVLVDRATLHAEVDSKGVAVKCGEFKAEPKPAATPAPAKK